ncbi:winged helix-turn-helix domain-containing protein [Paenibacillus larvae]
MTILSCIGPGLPVPGSFFLESFDPFSSVLRVHIANLRKKLTKKGGNGLLVTMKGSGYQLCGEKQ